MIFQTSMIMFHVNLPGCKNEKSVILKLPADEKISWSNFGGCGSSDPWNPVHAKRIREPCLFSAFLCVKVEIDTWNLKHLFINGCFNWMIPNLYIGNGCFTKHLFINGCLGHQAGMHRDPWDERYIYLHENLIKNQPFMDRCTIYPWIPWSIFVTSQDFVFKVFDQPFFGLRKRRWFLTEFLQVKCDRKIHHESEDEEII